jgi:hypothetical protein
MIFITFDPYNDYQFTYNYNSKDSSSNLLIKKTDDSIESSKFIENECFICMEDTKNIKLIKLNKQLFYWKNCQCDGDLHKECLEKWATLYNNCPICRINMIKNNNLIIKYINSNGYFTAIYFFYKKNLLNIKLCIIISFFLYNIFILIIFPIFLKKK